ncbi:MAG: hypothetical protein KF863_10820 [Rubrivivax sp.]|nr:hypothetical protein [Rubrivivax sp.]
MSTLHDIRPSGDDGASDKLRACGELLMMTAGDLMTLQGFIGSISDERGVDEAMASVAAAQALVVLLGQRIDSAAQRLGDVATSDAWTLTDRERELLDRLGPLKRRPAA